MIDSCLTNSSGSFTTSCAEEEVGESLSAHANEASMERWERMGGASRRCRSRSVWRFITNHYCLNNTIFNNTRARLVFCTTYYVYCSQTQTIKACHLTQCIHSLFINTNNPQSHFHCERTPTAHAAQPRKQRALPPCIYSLPGTLDVIWTRLILSIGTVNAMRAALPLAGESRRSVFLLCLQRRRRRPSGGGEEITPPPSIHHPEIVRKHF